MAENSAGSLIFTIDADASKLITAASKVDTASTDMSTSLSKTTKASDTLGDSFTDLGGKSTQLNTKMTTTAAGVKAATSSMAQGRMVVQQFGYQMQDAVVQLQMGTNWMRVMAQQAPQFLGVFGAAGAVAGLIVAIGASIASVLVPSFASAEERAKALDETMASLKDVMKTTEDGTETLSEKILKLAKVSESLARSEIARGMAQSRVAITQAGDAIGAASEQADAFFNNTNIKNASAQLDDLDRIAKRFGITSVEVFDGNVPAHFLDQVSILNDYVGRLENQFGLTADQSLQLVRAFDQLADNKTPANMRNIADVMANINQQNNYANDSFTQLAHTVLDNAQKGVQAGESFDFMKNALNNLGLVAGQSESVLSGSANAIARLVEQADLAEFAIGKTRGQLAAHAAAMQGADVVTQEYIESQLNQVDAAEKQQQKEREAAAEAKRAASQRAAAAKQAANAQQQVTDKMSDTASKAAQLGIEYNNLKKGIDDNSAATSRFTIESATLEAQRQLGAAATKAQIEAQAANILKIHEETAAIDKLKKKQAEDVQTTQKFETVESKTKTKGQSVQDQYNEDLKALENYHKMAGASDARYQKTKSKLEEKYRKDKQAAAIEDYKAQSEWNTFLMDGLDALGQSATTTIAGLASGTMTATEAMQNFANIILNQAVGALVSMGIEALKNQMVGQSAAATSVATASATGAAISSAYATPAFLANTATMGGASATGLASLQAGVASSQMLALAGARQFGGSVNAGGMYRVGENGRAEVFTQGGRNYLLPGDGGGQVTPMSGMGGGGFSQNVSIVNTSGASVSHNTSADGKQMRILVEQTVSKSISEKRGRIYSAFNRTTNLQSRAR